MNVDEHPVSSLFRVPGFGPYLAVSFVVMLSVFST